MSSYNLVTGDGPSGALAPSLTANEMTPSLSQPHQIEEEGYLLSRGTNRTHFGAINPSTGQPASVEAWQALNAPGDVFRHPREVLMHPMLSQAEKRAILASWASDVHAMESAPALRCLTGCKAEPVSVDTVLAILAELDRGSIRDSASPKAAEPPALRRLRPISNFRRYMRFNRRDDDDDPPPCPAAIMPRPRPSAPSVEAVAARA